MPYDRDDLPSTLKRSPKKAQDTFIEAHDSALDSYDGDEERAHRTAWSAVKHSFEKVDDRWEEKDEKGPSDERAADPNARNDPDSETAGGVDVRGSTKDELYERAKDLDVSGRSDMDKQELGKAIARKQDR